MAITKEQLAARKIGGSDVATILGLNPHKSALELYHEKVGTIDPVDLSANTSVEAGNVLEDGIAELAQKHMSRLWQRQVKLRRCNLTLVNPQFEWLTVHIDRDVVGEDRGVEMKNVGARAASNWGPAFTDEIPDYYVPQPHTYMLVKNYPVWTVAGYFGGDDLRLYEVARDREWDEIIIERTHAFWYDHVLKGVPPPFDIDGRRAIQILQRINRGTNGQSVVADESAEHWRFVCQEAARKASEYSAIADGAKAHLLATLGECSALRFADGTTFERKLVKRKGYVVDDMEYIDARFKKGRAE